MKKINTKVCLIRISVNTKIILYLQEKIGPKSPIECLKILSDLIPLKKHGLKENHYPQEKENVDILRGTLKLTSH